MALVVYAQRQETAQSYDTAIINDLEAQGWTVQVETGSLSAIEWGGVNLLIVGPFDLSYVPHVNADDLNGYDVDILTFCRNTARLALGMAGGSATLGLNGMTRVTSDPRALFSSVSFTAVNCQAVSALTSGTTIIYRTGTVGQAGIAERFRDGYSRIFFGNQTLSPAGSNMLAIWHAFTEPPVSQIEMDSAEGDDAAAFEIQYMPAGGFTVESAVQEEDDAAAFALSFSILFAVSMDGAEDDDVAAFSVRNEWTLAVTGSNTTFYQCEIHADGFDPLTVPISSWQGTLQIGRSSYLQAVVPAAAEIYSEIHARADGVFAIYRGSRFASGFVNRVEMARAPLQQVRLDRVPQRATVTMSGYTTEFGGESVGDRVLQRVRSLSATPGYRVRCEIDWYLRPGDNATAEGITFPVAYINYYANARDSYMDAGERAP
jgi:hypothetical protein